MFMTHTTRFDAITICLLLRIGLTHLDYQRTRVSQVHPWKPSDSQVEDPVQLAPHSVPPVGRF